MRNQLIALTTIIGILIISSFLSKIDFSNTGLPGLIGPGIFDSEGEEYEMPFSAGQSELSITNNSNPPCVPLFVVSGLDDSHTHLRTGISLYYKNGTWNDEEIQFSDIQNPSFGKIFKVNLLSPLERLPVPKDTISVSIPSGYNKSSGLFISKVNATRYYGVYVGNLEDPLKPERAFIDIENEKMEEIKKLAEIITANATTNYEKAVLIERYLYNNYEYSPYFNSTDDLIYNFLFIERKGICVHFASAFVALATSLDIPARIVYGYLAKPLSGEQVVYSCQGHMWAEVWIDGKWIEFDPTPPYKKKILTETEIVSWSREIVAGEELQVNGTVRLEDGRGVENGYVEIYLKEDKNSPEGEFLGLAEVRNGIFSFKKEINETGRFSIVAHYTGSLLYSDSWSDPEVTVYEKTEIKTNLNNYIPTEFTLKGEVECQKFVNGTLIVAVDEVKSEIYLENSTFELPLKLKDGVHDIRIEFPKQGFCSYAIFEKKVEAGEFNITVSPAEIQIGLNNNVMISVKFNEKPYEGNLKINGRDYEVNGTLNLTIAPDKPEKIPLVIEIGGEKRHIMLIAKARAEMKFERSDGKVVVTVISDSGKIPEGSVFVSGKKYILQNGKTVFDIPEDAVKVYYSGDEYHFPAEAEYNPNSPLKYVFLPVILLALIVGYYIKNFPRISYQVEKEFPDLPDLWKTGEKIRIKVKSNFPCVIRSEGKIFNDTIFFEDPGLKTVEIVAMKNGKERRKTSFRVKIVDDYGKGVEEVFRLFEKDIEKKGIKTENLTAREILVMFKSISKEKLLRFFELYEYAGVRNYTRKEFLEAFSIYKELRSEIV